MIFEAKSVKSGILTDLEVNLSEAETVLYLIVKRPDAKLQHKWRGSDLLEFHANEKTKNKIEKYRGQRLFVKLSTKRDIVCSVVVEDVVSNEDGTYMVKFNDIRKDHWVVPGEIKGTAATGFVEGRAPLPVPSN
jgi:hypothetical protein